MNKIGTLLVLCNATGDYMPIDDIYDKDLQPRMGIYFDSRAVLRYYKNINIFGRVIVLEIIEELSL